MNEVSDSNRQLSDKAVGVAAMMIPETPSIFATVVAVTMTMIQKALDIFVTEVAATMIQETPSISVTGKRAR